MTVWQEHFEGVPGTASFTPLHVTLLLFSQDKQNPTPNKFVPGAARHVATTSSVNETGLPFTMSAQASPSALTAFGRPFIRKRVQLEAVSAEVPVSAKNKPIS
jgi:hypothetical protein